MAEMHFCGAHRASSATLLTRKVDLTMENTRKTECFSVDVLMLARYAVSKLPFTKNLVMKGG